MENFQKFLDKLLNKSPKEFLRISFEVSVKEFLDDFFQKFLEKYLLETMEEFVTKLQMIFFF